MDVPNASRRRLAVRVARLVACGVTAAVLWACGPVYIPVPPPVPLAPTFTATMLTDATGNPRQVWIAMGDPDPLAGNATFYLFNQNLDDGVITRAAADGSYQAPALDGTADDHVLVYYMDTRGELSSALCVVLGEGRAVKCQ